MSNDDAVQVKFSEVDRRLDDHQDVHKELWTAVNTVKNRLPGWAVFVITALASLSTGLITLSLR